VAFGSQSPGLEMYVLQTQIDRMWMRRYAYG
jgi:hypothetical protein